MQKIILTKGVNKMSFAKGAIMGIIAGTVIGVMNSSNIIDMCKKGKKQMLKMKRRYMPN